MSTSTSYAKYSGLGSAGSGTVTSLSIITANGFAGTVATSTTTPAVTLTTTVTGILQGNGTAISAAATGNLAEATSSVLTIVGGTAAVLGSGVSIQVKQAGTSQSGYLSSADWNTFNGKGNGSVIAVSIASSNGFAGSSSGGATPALTVSTSITGILKGNGTAISAATAGTDYSAGTSALGTGILKSTTTTGALTIAVAGDFPTLNQSTTGSAANITASSNSTLTTHTNAAGLTLSAGPLLIQGAIGNNQTSTSVVDFQSANNAMRFLIWGAASTTGTFNWLAGQGASSTASVMSIDGTGNLTVVSLSGTGSRAVLSSASGVLSAPVSDFRLKKNIAPIKDSFNVLEAICKLEPVTFNWDTSNKRVKDFGDLKELGFIAQQVKDIVPNVVFQERDGYYGMSYEKLVPLLVQGIKDMKTQLDEIKERL